MHTLHGALCPTMRDLFLDGLPILDALEIGASTAVAARWLNCDQSSVSRTYRRTSEQLGLNFCKTNGCYGATGNLALLESLRQASQLRRLSAGGQLLQWLLHPALPLPPLLAALSPSTRPPLRCDWPEPQRLVNLLERRLVDLALLPAGVMDEQGSGACRALTALRLRGNGPPLDALLRQDVAGHQTLQQLLEAVAAPQG